MEPIRPAATAPRQTPWTAIHDGFTWQRVAVAAALAVAVAALLNPLFVVPFGVVLGRTALVAALLLLAFVLAGASPVAGLPRWLAQVVAIVLTAPLATLVAYWPSLDGGIVAGLLGHEGRLTGFVLITATALLVAPLLALGALYRERDAQARSAQLAFELERSTLERRAVDAQLKLLQAQIEPHFLFNTLANVQTLVEAGSPQAAAVLKSLIAYLRAAVPRMHEGGSTLGGELDLVRAYLELMHMRMPDRLEFSTRIGDELAALDFPPMGVLTLVENAVRHGIDPSEAGGRIDVGVDRDGAGEVRVVVADTGIGLGESASAGTGLANLRDRLRGFFGDRARLDLLENAPRGLRAEIVFRPRPASGGA